MAKYYKDHPWETGPRDPVQEKVDDDHLDYIERSGSYNPNETRNPRENYYNTKHEKIKTMIKTICWSTFAVICIVLLIFYFL